MNIRLENVSKTIKHNQVLNDITLELKSGSIYGLRGKNGAGKTMLLRLMCGLVLPSTGKVIIDDMQLGKEISFPKSVGVLIENPGFIRNYTGLRNLEVLASINSIVDRQGIIDLMEYFELDPFSKKKVRAFSLGMKQKLGIIGALMENPEIILLDEPLNALDEIATEKVQSILVDRKKAGALVVVASHDREMLDCLADEIFEIKNGSVVKNVLQGNSYEA